MTRPLGEDRRRADDVNYTGCRDRRYIREQCLRASASSKSYSVRTDGSGRMPLCEKLSPPAWTTLQGRLLVAMSIGLVTSTAASAEDESPGTASDWHQGRRE